MTASAVTEAVEAEHGGAPVTHVAVLSAHVDGPGAVAPARVHNGGVGVLILRVPRLHAAGHGEVLPGLVVPTPAEVEDAVEVVPLRVVQGDAIQDGLGGVQVVLGEVAPHPGELPGVIPGVTPLALPVAALAVGALPIALVAPVGGGGAVAGILLLLGEQLVGLVDLLQLLVSQVLHGAVGIPVRVILLHQIQIGLSDLLLGGVFADPQNLIRIHHGPPCRRFPTPGGCARGTPG